jgi:phage-related minor tail protein
MTNNLDIVIRAKNESQSALNELDKSLGGLDKKTTGLSGSMGKLGGFLGKGLVLGAGLAATALGAMGAAAFGVAQSFDDAQDALIAATGASGAALDGMSASVVALHGSVAGLDRSMADIAAVMGEVNTRTGATGPALDTFTAQILKMTRITGDDGVAAVAGITRVMGDWSVPLEDSSLLMDKLFGAGQTFGIGLDSLAGKLVQFGAPLRQMGFGLDESLPCWASGKKRASTRNL